MRTIAAAPANAVAFATSQACGLNGGSAEELEGFELGVLPCQRPCGMRGAGRQVPIALSIGSQPTSKQAKAISPITIQARTSSSSRTRG
jgi:hypothetical protein